MPLNKIGQTRYGFRGVTTNPRSMTAKVPPRVSSGGVTPSATLAGSAKTKGSGSDTLAYLAAGSAGAGLLGLLFGKNGAFGASDSFEDYDYDPERKASKRFDELTDPNSGFNKTLLGRYLRIASNAAPTANTLATPIRAAGGGSTGSASLAAYQAKNMQRQASEQAMEGFTGAYLNNEANAARYLGLEYDRARFQAEGFYAGSQDEQDFFDQLLNVGTGVLPYVI